MKNIIIIVSVAIVAYWAFLHNNNMQWAIWRPQTEAAAVVKPNFDADGYWHTDNFIAKKNLDQTISFYGTNSQYGAYLAGRVAHLRQDFENAAEYYKIAISKDEDNTSLNRTVYVILTSLGRIDEAVPYARKELANEKREMLAPMVVAVKEFTDGNYAAARDNMAIIEDNLHLKLINPLFNAWTYAGEKDEQKAIAAIDSIAEDPSLNVLKKFHKGMIYDYLGNKDMAEKCYEEIIAKYPKEVTYRILEIITNFFVRLGDKDKARRISGKYNNDGMLAILLNDIDSKIDDATVTTEPVIDSPQKGLSEAMFNIGTLFRAAQNGAEMAQLYIATSSYLNPQYEVSKIALANVLEESGLLKEANKYYSQIGSDSGSYFIARLKMIENYNSLEEYQAAEDQLKMLLQSYPDNTKLLSDLAGINSSQKKDAEAVRLYQQALDHMPQINQSSWPIFYAMAVSYDRLNQKDKSEANLQKALELSNRDPNVLNYLGYSWLTEDKNPDDAVAMILEAYRQYPYDGHIMDSLGWVYFKLGQYAKAIDFLEQASALNSGNAVISDHLGDAYWFGGRKNEAVFQWKHALVYKEDADLLDKAVVENKIENGLDKNDLIILQDKELLNALDAIEIKHAADK